MFGCIEIVITWVFQTRIVQIFYSPLSVEKNDMKRQKYYRKLKEKKGGKEISAIIPKQQQVVFLSLISSLFWPSRSSGFINMRSETF